MTSLTTPQGVMNYAYNLAGEQTSMTEVGVGTTTYAYDAYGRPASVTNPFGEVTTWLYDSAGRVNRQNFSSGAYEQYTYDLLSRLTGVTVKDSSGATVDSKTYAYNAVGNVTWAIESGVTVNYAYDQIDQLISESRPGHTASYTYDANGNRQTRTVNGTTETYSYDAGDKLLSVSWPGGSKSYTYDSGGNTTSVTSAAGTTQLLYDYEGRVKQIIYPDFSSDGFTYNGLDSRVGTSGTSGTKSYKRDGIYVTDPVLSDGLANYTPGISERRGGTSTFTHSGLKNADAQSGTGQTVLASRQYDAFGNLLTGSGSWSGA